MGFGIACRNLFHVLNIKYSENLVCDKVTYMLLMLIQNLRIGAGKMKIEDFVPSDGDYLPEGYYLFYWESPTLSFFDASYESFYPFLGASQVLMMFVRFDGLRRTHYQIEPVVQSEEKQEPLVFAEVYDKSKDEVWDVCGKPTRVNGEIVEKMYNKMMPI